jgi:hypothetical protein
MHGAKGTVKMKRFSEFESTVNSVGTRMDVMNETVNQKVSSVARLLFREIRQLHLETLDTQSAGAVEKRLSAQIVALSGLVFLVLSDDDPTLVSIARSAQ